jgi:homoserine dehydrogenase
MKTSTVIRIQIGSEADLPHAVHEIYRAWRIGRAVIAVVSGQEPVAPIADDLLRRAEQLGLPTQPGALAALLVHALDRSGLPATLFDPLQTGLLTQGIWVASDTPGFAERQPPARPAPGRAPLLRVALLGCGTVGGGVLARLLARPDLFQVTGVAVRDLERERPGVPRGLLVRDPAALVRQEADVVVELLGGTEPARSLIVSALEQGRSVVTANKALLAAEAGSLTRLAGRRGVSLRFSASVGGALPALEAVRRAAAAGRVQSISGVLNGTCNDVLDRCAAGLSFDDALTAAREAGYAEADPLLDLDGSDAAQKLALLAREAFGTVLDWRRIPRRGILGLDRSVLEAAARRGQAVRLVATCERTAAGLRSSVQPLEVPHGHLFAKARGADNALRIESRDGRVTDLTARGAGRWPTTEAVMADLFDLVTDDVEVAA